MTNAAADPTAPRLCPGDASGEGEVYQTVSQWIPTVTAPAFTPAEVMAALRKLEDPLIIIRRGLSAELGVGVAGRVGVLSNDTHSEWHSIVGILPAMAPETLGDRRFCIAHQVRYAYIAGEMANGISTTQMVTAVARAGMLGFFGAAGLELEAIDGAISRLQRELSGRSNWGVNLIHTPGRPDKEEQLVDLLLRRGVTKVSASAFVHLTPAVVWCAAHGLKVDSAGRVVRPIKLFAKLSRPEVATVFMSPPPTDVLQGLVQRGLVTESEARLAAQLPVAENVTVEADSGGHTDNRPLVALLPTILSLRDELRHRYGYPNPIFVGAAGGLGTPSAVAAAFALGAAYVLTGSINQLSIESGISSDAKGLLAEAGIADVTMAPSADMFELGVKVQVLRRGSLFAARAGQLYEVYRTYPSLDEIPPAVRAKLEAQVLHASFDEIWSKTEEFWRDREPAQLIDAARNPKYRMALLFRWYLGMSSRWAIEGSTSRRSDYQLWCGPAVGAFNRWVAGSFLANPARQSVVQIGLNLMEGAALHTRASQMRMIGIELPDEAFDPCPQPFDLRTEVEAS